MLKVKKSLLIFSRYPEPGKTKTRLIPALGEHGAARLQRLLTEQTIKMALDLCRSGEKSVALHYDGGDQGLMHAWLHGVISCIPQVKGDLGNRMAHVFHDGFASGLQKIIIIGTDCPTLTPEIINLAFSHLDSNDLVLGPALDGGYYLIGLKKKELSLFHHIHWGTTLVLEQTLKQAKKCGLSHSLLEPLADVDRPEDLCHLDHYPDLK